MRRRITSRKAVIGLAALMGALVALPSGVTAQQAAGAAPPAAPAVSARPAGDGLALAEEIAVLRAVTPLKPTPDQLAALTTVATQAQERLAQQTRTDVRALAALRSPTARARQQLLPESVNLNDPQLGPALMVDQQVTNAYRTAAQNQARLRDELSAALRRQFETLLTPVQVANIVAQGRAMLVAERAAQQQGQQRQQAMAARWTAAGPRAGGANGGGRGGRGGPGGRGGQVPQSMMDRLRGRDSDQYQQMSRGLARRFGDEGTPAYQNALAGMDQIRSMPEVQFRSQRADLAQQFGAGMASAQSGASAADTISADHAADTWIRRYLLSPQAPVALKDLTAAESGAKGSP